ncbi:DNA topoisomerase-like [Raphidocelis subcapitata]|uniref:DNA topoisomerase 1 n=1 Tax=Raphidocelis subcapitata TaxID=307507 RepID=A0A2V0PNI9_9CHLO|nr:DNA topoisomerase-like [Raphidocelis subcapitata]|eukprot:GBF98695.1 DNA topoisomerase-like [Raphidocelis subcapitata]
MSDSEDDVPLGQRAAAAPKPTPMQEDSSSEDDQPLAARAARTPASKRPSKAVSDSEGSDDDGSGSDDDASSGSGSDDSDDVPLAQRRAAATPAKKKPAPAAAVAVLFEVVLERLVLRRRLLLLVLAFIKNFWEGFREVLGPRHVIKSLDKCDFTPIYDWHAAEREKKKGATKEEKQQQKEEREAKEAKYKFALVGNFRVEPPGLFRGRGEHPKMGKVKKRVYPRDITINIGKDAPIPEHPYPGQRWKEVRHDSGVTWLAYWRDTVNPKEFKYVWLSANSTFKSESDLLKYEKARAPWGWARLGWGGMGARRARKLKDFIVDIRRQYTKDWGSSDMRKKQMGVALYFLDKLALRAGHEKDEDEADTVGCCTLKVENVECIPPNHIKFDFLGKDSIRYENTVEVEVAVYRAVEQFLRCDERGKRKAPRDMLFDAFDATDLNKELKGLMDGLSVKELEGLMDGLSVKELKGLMDGLSVKVFRTYNASITLDRLLAETEDASAATTVDEKKAEYDRANKEARFLGGVAILCNHQRSVPKTHGTQMEKMNAKLDGMRDEITELQAELALAKKGKANKEGKKLNPEAVEKKIAGKKRALAKAELAAAVKEDLKTVALGTSKINYMDPRITIAWAKRNELDAKPRPPPTDSSSRRTDS